MACTPIKRVELKIRAGATGFQTEQPLGDSVALDVPDNVMHALNLDPEKLLAIRVRDSGMEPMFFEDDWIVIDTGDITRRSREVYAVNWNGEACVQQLVERGGQWYSNYVNPSFKPVNMRSGALSIVGRVVYQPGRVIIGRL